MQTYSIKRRLTAAQIANLRAMNRKLSHEEQKLVTEVFAGFVGSTELTVRKDPEQLRSLLSAFFEAMAQQIRTFGATVEKYIGYAVAVTQTARGSS